MERADASTAAGRAQRGTAREREGAFGNPIIIAEVRYSPATKHYRIDRRKRLSDAPPMEDVTTGYLFDLDETLVTYEPEVPGIFRNACGKAGEIGRAHV